MHHLRNSKACPWLVSLLAAVIFNLSIDPPDRESPGMPEDLSVNEIESFVELVAEQWLAIEDFLPEHNESDDSGFAKKGFDYRFARSRNLLAVPEQRAVAVITYPFSERFTVQYKPEPRVPPPWA